MRRLARTMMSAANRSAALSRVVHIGLTAFLARLSRERDRWPLLVPVFLGTGIGIYFTLPLEPPIWAGMAGTCVLAIGAGLVRRRFITAALGLAALAIVSAGFTVGTLRTAAVDAPILAKKGRTCRDRGYRPPALH